MIAWQNMFNTGLGEVDIQHQKLVQLINRLHEVADRKASTSELGSVLSALVDYTRYHFDEEERIMKEIHFVGAKVHIKSHDELRGVIAQILRRLKETGDFNPYQVIANLQGWLINHVLREDKALGLAAIAARNQSSKSAAQKPAQPTGSAPASAEPASEPSADSAFEPSVVES